MSETERLIRERLATLRPSKLSIEDESAAHAGHAGARSGGGHYRLHIESEVFRDRNTVMSICLYSKPA